MEESQKVESLVIGRLRVVRRSPDGEPSYSPRGYSVYIDDMDVSDMVNRVEIIYDVHDAPRAKVNFVLPIELEETRAIIELTQNK